MSSKNGLVVAVLLVCSAITGCASAGATSTPVSPFGAVAVVAEADESPFDAYGLTAKPRGTDVSREELKVSSAAPRELGHDATTEHVRAVAGGSAGRTKSNDCPMCRGFVR